MKQTAIEWLATELGLSNDPFTMKRINQAKELEKQQMFEFTKKIHVIGQQTEDFYTEEFDKYYNETYKSNE